MRLRTGTTLGNLAPARRRFVLAAILTPLLVGLAVLTVRTVGAHRPSVAQDVPGPVLLVGGYGGSTRSLEPLRRTLLAAGRDVVVVPAVGDGTGDIAAQARALGERAASAMRHFGASSVDVVGYSAGGVVAREWVRQGGAARRVLTIGSPQHGTAVAELAVSLTGRCPTACRQLEPDSDLLRVLNARDETPPGPVFVSVWSTSDQLVVPPESARLEGAVNLTVQSLCPARRTSHGELPSDPVVRAVLGSALGAGPATAPTRAECG